MNAACQCLFGETVVQIPPENAIASNKPHAENALVIRRSQNNVRVSRLFVSLSSSTARLCFDVRIEKGVVLYATGTYGVLSLYEASIDIVQLVYVFRIRCRKM